MRTGSPLSLDPKAATATVVVFLSARCPCSRSHEPTLKRLAAEFTEFAFVAVHANANESIAEATAHFQSAGLPFPIVKDVDSRLANAFGALKTPHVFVVNKKGECVFRGGVDDSKVSDQATKHYLQEALLALREGRRPNPAEVRSLGCVIER